MDALVCVLVFSSRTARASVAVSRAAPRCSRGSSLAIIAPVLTVSSTCPDGGAPQPVGEGLVGRVEPPPPHRARAPPFWTVPSNRVFPGLLRADGPRRSRK